MSSMEREAPNLGYRYTDQEYLNGITDTIRGFFYFRSLPPPFINALAVKGVGIAEIGAGRAETASGLRILLSEELKLDASVLSTDILSHTTTSMVIDDFFVRYPTVSYRIAHGGEGNLVLSASLWNRARRGIHEAGGKDWDGTSDDFYDRALAKLREFDPNTNKVALWIRQPEISDDAKEPVFRAILANMVTAADIHRVPILVATSSKIVSNERSRAVLTGTLEERGFQFEEERTEDICVGDYESKKRVICTYKRTTGCRRMEVIIEDTLECSKIMATREVTMMFHTGDLYFGGKARFDFEAYILIPEI